MRRRGRTDILLRACAADDGGPPAQRNQNELQAAQLRNAQFSTQVAQVGPFVAGIARTNEAKPIYACADAYGNRFSGRA